MIVAQLEDFERYVSGAAWRTAFEFLQSLDGDSPDGRQDLDGDKLYAIISSYETMPVSKLFPESHREFTDIQMVLSGRERIDWCPVDSLTEVRPYSASNDVVFYDLPDTACAVLELVPSRLAVFYPEDAHMPGVQVGEISTPVKKVVVKIHTSLV